MSVDRLIDRASELKQELVAYALSPGCSRSLDAEVERATEPGRDTEEAVIDAVETLLFDGAERGQKTLLERYLADVKDLSVDDRAILEGWRDRSLYGIFEVGGRSGSGITLVNLVDGLSYDTSSTVGEAAITRIRSARYVATRVVPLAEAWIFSGLQRLFSKDDRDFVAELVSAVVQDHPTATFRNPAKLEQALQISRRYHDTFVSMFGAERVGGSGADAAVNFRRFLEECKARISAEDGLARPASGVVPPDPLVSAAAFPADFLNADDMVMFSHPVKGVTFYRDFERLERAHRDVAFIDEAVCELLRSYLDDESIAPFALSHLAAESSDVSDELYRRALGRPDFRWRDDGEALLREHKAKWYKTSHLPGITVLPKIAADAHGTAGQSVGHPGPRGTAASVERPG